MHILSTTYPVVLSGTPLAMQSLRRRPWSCRDPQPPGTPPRKALRPGNGNDPRQQPRQGV